MNSADKRTTGLMPHALTGEVEGSVRNYQTLQQLVERAKSLLGQFSVITVPRGVIDHEALGSFTQGLSQIQPQIGGATPHAHPGATCLISNGQTATPTLIFDAEEAVRQTLETANGKLKNRLIEVLKVKHERNGAYFDAVLTDMNTVLRLEDGGNRDRLLRIELNNAQFLLTNAGSDFDPIIYGFVAEVQERLAGAVSAIEWENTDMLIFDRDVVHGRDVRHTNHRSEKETLFSLPLRHQ